METTPTWQSHSNYGATVNNAVVLGHVEQRQQEQQPPYGPYSANYWTTPGPSAHYPPTNSPVPTLPPATHQSMAPPRHPAFNPETENCRDVLPSYEDAVTDAKGSKH